MTNGQNKIVQWTKTKCRLCFIFTAGAAISNVYIRVFTVLYTQKYSQFLLWNPVAVAPKRSRNANSTFDPFNVLAVCADNWLLPVRASSRFALEISLRADVFIDLYLFCNESMDRSHFCKLKYKHMNINFGTRKKTEQKLFNENLDKILN